MRPVALLLALSACKAGSAPSPSRAGDTVTYSGGSLSDDDVEQPPYDKSALAAALATERAAETAAAQRVQELADAGDYDQLHVVRRDLAVRQRFIATLQACEATGRVCPPRLDDPAWSFDIASDADPKLDASLRFDVESWRTVAAELHGRACACRTIACIDSMFVAIERLETRPPRDVQPDEAASVSITRARDCLYRLRGLRPVPKPLGD